MHGQHPYPPRVTLNSGKLITIDWGCWQLQEDDVYLHVCFPSLKSHPNSLPSHLPRYPLRSCQRFFLFLFSYFFPLHPSLSLCFSLSPRFSLTLCVGIPMRRGDAGCRAPEHGGPSAPPKTSFYTGPNWPQLERDQPWDMSLWVNMYWMRWACSCLCPFVCVCENVQQTEVMNTHSLQNNAFT